MKCYLIKKFPSKPILFLIIILLSVILSACEEKLQPPKTDISAQDIPDQESWNSTVAFSDSGDVKAVLIAGYIAHFQKKGYMLIDSGATVDFFRNGEEISNLIGKRGIVIDSTKDIEMYDSVTIINKEGSILNTTKLYWDNDKQIVSSDEYVKIKTPAEEVEGIGFTSDAGLKNYTIYKVTGTFSK